MTDRPDAGTVGQNIQIDLALLLVMIRAWNGHSRQSEKDSPKNLLTATHYT